jgi:uncharacterized membrane protein HdeD (DUF308 family)
MKRKQREAEEVPMSSGMAVPENTSSVSLGPSKKFGWFPIAIAILLIVFGLLAILLPVEMSIGVVIVLSWMLMFGGIVQLIDAFRGTGFWHIVWKIALAVGFFAMGLFLRFHPGIGLVALTFALITFFVAQGVIDVFVYFRMRKKGAYGSVLVHGIITLILGLLIWRHWPSGSLWVLGTFAGINMIITGTTLLMLTIRARRVVRMIAQDAS